MKLIFAGTPSFAAASLTALSRAGHDIALVLAQPDRPAGRGMRLRPCAVAAEARRLGLTLAQPPSLKSAQSLELLRNADADAMVVAAYGQLLPPAVLALPRHGCLNVHGSLLPRWRGAAPVPRAIEAGDGETGITIMQMDAGLDTGPIVLEKPLPILADDTSATLFEKLAALGAECIVETLAAFPWKSAAQPAEGVSYARKIEKSEGRIDWTRPAAEIERKLRAFDPFPGCEAALEGAVLKIWRARTAEGDAKALPGTVLAVAADSLRVQCGSGALSLSTVQRPGGRRVSVGEFLRGGAIAPGSRFS